MFDLYFDGQWARNLGAYVVTRPPIGVPSRIYDEYVIPGRDGVLTSATSRFEPLDISVDINFKVGRSEDFGIEYRVLKNWLLGASVNAKLMFSDDPDIFYKVISVTTESVTRNSKRIGLLTVNFRCDPYSYLTEGTTYMSASEAAVNPGVVCHPIYYIVASDSWTLTVNGNTLTGSGNAYVDTDRMVAYYGSTIKNTSTLGDFADLYLQEGSNTITLSSGTLTVQPNWRRI